MIYINNKAFPTFFLSYQTVTCTIYSNQLEKQKKEKKRRPKYDTDQLHDKSLLYEQPHEQKKIMASTRPGRTGLYHHKPGLEDFVKGLNSEWARIFFFFLLLLFYI